MSTLLLSIVNVSSMAIFTSMGYLFPTCISFSYKIIKTKKNGLLHSVSRVCSTGSTTITPPW